MFIIRYLLLSLLLLLSNPLLSAQLPDDIEPGDSINEIKLPLTKQSAAELIRVELGGKVLSVDKKAVGKGFVFRVKVLHTDGTVKFHKLNPNTGHRAE